MDKFQLLASLESDYGLPNGLLKSVMTTESGGRADAVSPKGARGYFQFMPATAKAYGVNPTDFNSSATGAARMYADLLKQHNGDLDKALASYNWGSGNVSKNGLEKAPAETKNYITKVKSGMDMEEKPWEDFAPQQADTMPWEDFAPQAQPKSKTVTPSGKRFMQGVKDPFDAGAQLLTKILPDSVVNAGNQLNNYIADKTGLVANIPQGGVDQMLNDQAKQYNAPEGMDWARLGGNIVSPANYAIASKIPTVGSLGSRMLGGAVGGAALGAVGQPVTGDNKDFTAEKAKQIGVGALAGGLLPAVTGGIARVIKPNASSNPNVQLLRKEGVNPTIGQTLGGRMNALEEKAQSLPIMGDMISNARKGANSQFEAAAFNRALKPIGQELPKGVTGREALIFTESTLKNNYDDVLNKIGAIKPDQQFNSKIDDLQSMVNKAVMPKAEKIKFNSALSDVKQSIDQNGVITSQAFKELESSLGRDASKLGASTNIYEGKLAPAVKQLQAELRDMLKRQAGDSADDLQKANSAWANFKRVQNAAGKIGAEDGAFTPAQFQNAVRALDRSKDKAAFARGSALGQDLGDAGKSVLGSKVPNSGTAERLLYGGGALGSYMINPAIPTSLLGGAALYSSPVQKLLNSLVLGGRGQAATKAAELVRNSSNYMIPAASAVGLGLLQKHRDSNNAND